MKLSQRSNLMLHLSVALAVLAFATADGQPLLAALGLAAVSACLLLSGGRRAERPPALPRFAINTLVVAAIVNAAFRATGESPTGEPVIISTLGQFLVFIALIKLLDRRAPRDDAQLVTLSVFIAIAAVLTGNQFLVGLLLVAFVPCALAAAMLWQLRSGEVLLRLASAGPGGPAGTGGIDSPRPASGRHPRRGFFGVCASAVLTASALATVLFVVMPRLGGNFLGRFGETTQIAMGFREQVKLGQAGFLNEDPTPVFDLELMNSMGETLGNAGDRLYLRGASRDQYNPQDAVWEDSSVPQANAGPPGRPRSSTGQGAIVSGGVEWTPRWNMLSRGEAAPGPPRGDLQRITMRANSSILFCLWRPVSLTPDRDVSFSFSPESGSIHLKESPGPRFSYTVKSTVATTDGLLLAPRAPAEFQNGPIREYAGRVVDAARGMPRDPAQRTPRQIATAIQDDLRTNFKYTTEIEGPEKGEDAIEFFLFRRKAGHCEYFASAMAAMCQSQGLPARVVTGYVATDFNTLTGQYTVRQSNAHAWVEVFFPIDPETGAGRWEKFDPSPQADIDRIHRPPGGLLARLRSWYDALEFGWSSSVIGFDNASIRRRAGAFGGRGDDDISPRLVAWADQFASWLKTMRADPSKIPWWLRWSPVMLGGLAVAVVLLRRSLFGRVRLARSRAQKRAEFGLTLVRPPRFYAKALAALARAGFPKPDCVPPGKHTLELAAQSREAARSFQALTDLYYRVRFGGRPLSAQEAAGAEDSVRDLRAALRSLRRRRPGESDAQPV